MRIYRAICAILIFGMPVVIAVSPFFFIGNKVTCLAAIPFAVLLFGISYVCIAGLLCRPFQKAIVKGTFSRDPRDKVYGGRFIYGFCWTSIYYFKLLYSTFLTFPILKKLLFRIFGLRGNMEFTLYPDTWVRDLPLLHFGEGAYLSNRATVGTNMVFHDSIFVEDIAVGKKGIVGHLAILGPGSVMEDNSELGVDSSLGIRSRLEKDVKVHPACTINHGVRIEEKCDIGSYSNIGLKVHIRKEIRLPAGSNIPPGAIVSTQEEADSYFSSETSRLLNQRMKLANMLQTLPAADV